MARGTPNYIAHWRKFRGLTQRELVERLTSYAAEHPGVDVPTTEATLSRAEAGKQNFKVALLEAVSHILDDGTGEPSTADLLGRNPYAGTLQVISFVDALDERQQRMALDVLQAMFPKDTETA